MERVNKIDTALNINTRTVLCRPKSVTSGQKAASSHAFWPALDAPTSHTILVCHIRLTPGWGISALLFTLMVPKLLFLSLRAGSQLAVVVLLVILFAILGELYTERGSLLSTSIFMYAATAPVNGYFGGSLYARWISTNIVFSPTSLILYYYLLLIKLQMGQ